MNDLYKNEISLLSNYFLPSVKLKSKTLICGKVVKVIRCPQKTPVKRILKL